jgi:class 3 adenylate cyclase/tetratricopeptide (TPR) repeat protein
MRCSNCGIDNAPGSRFCNQCATPLSKRCAKCAFENAPEAKFCAQCSAPLDAAAPIRPVTERHDSLTGERRHLTVLFCDLVNSTSLAAQLDPEEWREMVAGYHHAAAQAVERFGGHVAQYLGDGVMAFFGYPGAHDNDAERAARAGLAMLDAISKLNEHPIHPKLSARIGIDSGAVVVGAGAGKDTDVFGDTPNIAARVQAAAAPGTVLVTAATHRLVSGLFVVEDRGAQALKGIERPIQLYRVIQPSGVRGRLEAAAAAHGLTPFVGREDELRLLMNRWERALDGEGQVALIVGEAGIGKSRMAQRFHEQTAGTPHTWLEAAAGVFFQNTPFYPVSEVLRHLVWKQNFDRLDDYLRELQTRELQTNEKKNDRKDALRGARPADEQLAQLQSGLVLAGLTPAEAIPLIAPLLNLPVPARYLPSALPPEQQRRRLLATLVEWVLSAARVEPTVIAIEDLHWADPSTLELIQLLVEQGATSRLLLLYTARPEFHAPWPPRAHHTHIRLNRLSSRNVRMMVGEVAAQKALSEETIATVVERTGGVPLFVEELTRVVLESGSARLTGREIPVTLHDSLMARLDRLGPAKEVIQVGAVIGGEFSYEVLHAVHPIAEEELQRALRTVADAELIYVRGIAPDATYQFKHALIRDAAYEALLKTRRRELHRHVANVVSQQFPDVAEAQPEILAHHYTEAGLASEAVPFWLRAGETMSQRSAHVEAIRHLTRGLELLRNLPDTSERTQQELALQMAMGASLLATAGFATPETGKAYSRARELCLQLGETSHLFPALMGLRFFYTAHGESQNARELGEQLLRLAQGARDTGLMVEAHYALAVPLHFLGEFVSAREHLEQSIALYDPRQHRDHAVRYGVDAGVAARSLAAWVLWELGYPDRALKKSREALSLARELSHPFTLAYALTLASTFLVWRREPPAVLELTDGLIPLCQEQGFSSLLTSAILVRDWALEAQGKQEESAVKLQAPAGLRVTDSQSYVTGLLARLIDAHAKKGKINEGMRMLSEALATVESTGERHYEAELHRLMGELLRLRDGAGDQAEQSFRTAIRIARGQNAKSLELRVAMSLARLLRDTNRRDEASTMLAEIYGWFTEGFDTADLKDAKTLLDELGR